LLVVSGRIEHWLSPSKPLRPWEGWHLENGVQDRGRSPLRGLATHDPGSLNVQYLETLLQEYLQDASRGPVQWQRYFREVTGGNGEAAAASA
jgi:hypothetical protein